MQYLNAGGCYVPILPNENPDRVNYILNDCNPKIILTHKHYDGFLMYPFEVINIDTIDLDKKKNNVNVEITPENVAYIIYTSGSTGNPKGTMVTHKNICSLKKSIENDFILKATEKDVSMSLLKYSFDASGIDIYTSLLFGGKLVLVSKEDELNPEKVIRIIENQKVTRSFLIPKWIEHIALQDKLLDADISSLKILGTGGEVLKPYILESLLSKYSNLKVLNLYGPTETTMFTTIKPISIYEIKNNYTSIGKPIYGARLAIVNEFNELLPIESKGELVIYEDDNSILNIADGYLNLPEQTEKRFIKMYHSILKKNVRAYKTGDIAKINKNLEIEFVGRTDDIVKINGGYLVALNEVENQINKALGNDYEVCPVAVPYHNSKIIVLFVKQSDNQVSVDTIKDYINKNISFYMRPKKYIEIEDFPRNSSGKINKKELKELAQKYLLERTNKIISPRTDTEKEIFEIVSSISKSKDLSILDDFVDDLGLDSLSITTLYSALSKYNIAIQDIYNNSNIKDLADYIDNNNDTEITPDLSNLQNAKILNNVRKFDLSTVLLTGVTGFLGIHLLRELLFDKNVKKIYCIIRNKIINLSSKNRLDKALEYYFSNDEEILNLINEKVQILNGDITKSSLGLDKKTYTMLQDEVTTVINSAANVKHFAKISQIRKDNVISVDNLIEFCQNKISLAHISTLSVAGYQSDEVNNRIYNENTLYIGQDFNNNPYLISKFETEKNILIKANSVGLNAVIFRLGNIMPRYSDGVFQENYTQNVFLSAISSILKSGVITQDLNSLKIEFSPVDKCSNIILKILNAGRSNTIYHVLTDKLITIFEFKSMLKELGYNISDVNFQTFIDTLSQYSDEYTKEYILGNKLNPYSQDLTLDLLKQLGITWEEFDIQYLKKIIDVIKKF